MEHTLKEPVKRDFNALRGSCGDSSGGMRFWIACNARTNEADVAGMAHRAPFANSFNPLQAAWAVPCDDKTSHPA